MALKPITDFASQILKPYINNQDKAYAANIAPVETSPATAAHTAGTQLIYNGVLYDVTEDIAANDALATTGAGANIAAADKVTEQISAQKQALANVAEFESLSGVKNFWDIEAYHGTGATEGGTSSYSNGTLTIGTNTTNPSGRYLRGSDLKSWFADFAGIPVTISFDVKGDSTFNASVGTTGAQEITQLTSSYQRWSKSYEDISDFTAITFWSTDTSSAHTITVTNFMCCPTSMYKVDPTYQPYAKPNTELTKDDNGLTANAFANGAVNLLPNTKTSSTVSGITYTVNDDGSVLVNAGTAGSGGSTFAIESSSDNWKLPAGRYKLSGAPTSIDGTILQLNIRAILSSGTVNFSESGDRGKGLEFTITDAMVNDASYKLVVFINLAGSKTLSSNILIKPMITLADVPNSDYNHYVPYAKSNKELTDALFVIEHLSVTSQSAASGTYSIDVDVTKTGYNVVGVVGFALARKADLYYCGVTKKNNSTNIVTISGYNASESAQTVSGNIDVMYQKA